MEPNSTERFYASMPSFSRFEGFLDDRHYKAVPQDWWMIISDIRNSTHAIQNGAYQDVNLAGASTIMAAINLAGALEIPYVFGGDGATILVPQSLVSAMQLELRKVKRLIRLQLALEMRIGFVSLSELQKLGAYVEVAKYQLSPGNHLAMLRGNGVQTAEKLIKQHADLHLDYNLPELDHGQPNLEGLSCRWQPLQSRFGVMLSLLVLCREGESRHRVYTDVIRMIDDCVQGRLSAQSPAHASSFRAGWPPQHLWFEALSQKSFGAWRAYLQLLIVTALVRVCVAMGWRLGPFDPHRYKVEMAQNADYRKFDDMLRMVIDCTTDQAEQISKALTEMQMAGSLDFGLHRSSQALMTCLVFSIENGRHLHFIDGQDGGYAVAALQLKRSLGERSDSAKRVAPN